jgi:hypothetical protein
LVSWRTAHRLAGLFEQATVRSPTPCRARAAMSAMSAMSALSDKAARRRPMVHRPLVAG